MEVPGMKGRDPPGRALMILNFAEVDWCRLGNSVVVVENGV